MADVKKSVEIAINVTGIKDSQLKSFSKSFDDLKKVVASTKQSIDKFAENVKKIKPALSEVATGSTKVKNKVKEMGDEFTKSGLKVKTFGDKIRTVAQFRGISAGLLALTGTFQAATTAIVEYDQALKDLQAITGATEFEVGQMGAKILDVANTTKFSASEIAEGMRTIGQAGFNASEAVETMQAVSDLATGTLSDMNVTVDLVTTAMRVFGIEASRSSEIADVFANSVNKSKLTVDKLRTAMNYIGPIAKAAGVSFKELSASMGVLANSGLRASTIGTGLRRVFAELVDPSAKLEAAAKKAGVAMGELDPTTSSLAEVLSNLKLVVNDAQVAFDVFGKRGAAAVLALSGSQSTFDSMLVSVSKSGTAAEMAAIQMEGLGVAFKNLKDRMGVLAIAIGELGITDAFRILIDLGKELANVLLFLVTNPMTKFAVKLIALPVVILAVVKALALLKASSVFVTAIPQVAAFSAALKGASASAVGLNVALGPILLIMTGLYLATSAFYDSFVNGATKASNAASELAQEFGSLSDKINNYRVAAINMKEGSEGLTTEALRLREGLIAVANSTSELAEEAAIAASSIDPLTGVIDKQSTALEEFQNKVDSLNFKELTTSVELAGKALDQQTNFVVRKINSYYDSLRIVSQAIILNFDFTEELAADRDRADELSAALANGSAKFKDLLEWKQKYGDTDFSTQGKALNKDIEFINEKLTAFIAKARETNNISLDDTEEGFRKVGETLKLSGLELDTFVHKMGVLAKANEGTFNNIIEKWSKNKDPKFLSNVVDSFNKIQGLQEEIDKQEVISFEKEQQRYVILLANLKNQYKEEVAKYGESKELVTKFLNAEQRLLEKADITKQKMAESASVQRAIAYAKELEKRQKLLEIADVTYSQNLFKREEEKRRIISESNKNIQEMASEDSTDPKIELAKYKEAVKEKEAAHADHLAQIEAQEQAGVVNSIQSDADKKTAALQHFADLYVLAKNYYDKVAKLNDPKEVGKAHKVLLQAEKKYYQEKEKFSAFDNKLIKRRKDQAEKILKVEKDLAKKIEKINDDLVKKLKSIDDSRLKNKKVTNGKILDLEEDTKDKIDTINSRDFTDKQKDAANAFNAAKKYSRGRTLLAEAEKEKDLEKFKIGQDLLEQSSDLYAGLDDEKNAINGVELAAKALKKALTLEGHLKDLELVEKKNDAIAAAELKRVKAGDEAKAKKTKLEIEFEDAKLNIESIKRTQLEAVTAVHEERTHLEELRHLHEMKNIELEIKKLKEKQSILGPSSKAVTGDKSIDNAARSEASLRLANEQAVHNVIIANIDAQIAKLEEKAKAEVNIHKKIETESKASFSSELKQVEEISKQGFRIIEENGVKTFTDLTDSQRKMVKEVASLALEGTAKTFSDFSSETKGSFEIVRDEYGKIKKILGEGIRVEIADVEVPDIKEDLEANLTKIDPIEIPVTIDDVDDTLDLLFSPDEVQALNVEVNVKDAEEVQTLVDNLGEENLPGEIESSIKIKGLDLALKGVTDLVEKIAELKDKTITITQNIVTRGGAAQYALGAILPGYGGGDRNPALLEDGEGIIRKEAVRMPGVASFINSLNNLRVPKFSLGGIMGQMSNSGMRQSSTNSLKDFGKVTLSSGQMEIPALLHKDTFSEVTDKLNKLKRFST